MRLLELARTFSTLEATSSRLKLVELVAELLARARPEELEPVVYLLLGTLRPPWEGVETGIGEKLLQSTLARVYGKTTDQVRRRMAKAGDMGLVAESLASAARSRVTVRQAYQVLLEVAAAAGSGALGRKTTLLADLLGKLTGLEARYLVRAAQGSLRLGVGDQTVLEAAALGALGDRGKKPLLEHAYNVRADLGDVVRVAFTQGASGLARIGPALGVPVRPALAQRLASAAEIVQRLGPVQGEPKFDGFRLQLHRRGQRVWAFSRRLENVTAMFPELVDGIRRQLKAERVILEGEALVHNPETGEFLPFQVTMTRKRKSRVAESAERYPLRLFAFDLLYLGQQGWLDRPQRERTRRLRQLVSVRGDGPIAVPDTIETADPEELQAYFDDMINRGLEGIMAKRPDAAYQAGARGYHWVKLKRAYHSHLRDTVDLVLVGYLRGRGKRAALGIGSLLAAVYDPKRDRFRTVAKIGAGLSERGWRELRASLDRAATRTRPRRVDALITPDVWVEPRHVVEVLADEITRSPSHTCGRSGDAPGYALRFPRMLGLRPDKAPDDTTTEREILDLYRKQRQTK